MWRVRRSPTACRSARWAAWAARAAAQALGSTASSSRGSSSGSRPVRIPPAAVMPRTAPVTAVRDSSMRCASLAARLAASPWSHQAGSSYAARGTRVAASR